MMMIASRRNQIQRLLLFNNKNKLHFTRVSTTTTSFTKRFQYTMTEDSKIVVLSSIDNIRALWNDGSYGKALEGIQNELLNIDKLMSREPDTNTTMFLNDAKGKLHENEATMLFMMDNYEKALPAVEQVLSFHEQQFQQLSSEQKRSSYDNYIRKTLQLILEKAECLRKINRFDECVKLLNTYCDKLTDSPMLVICLRERLGWAYLQRALDLKKEPSSNRQRKSELLQSSHSHLSQALHNFNIGAALAKEISVFDNYEEFTKDDAKSVMDVFYSRGVCYQEIAELLESREESSKHLQLAVEDFTRVIEKDNKYYVALFRVAECYAKLEKFNYAGAYYDQFLEHFQSYVIEEKQKGAPIRAEELYIEMRIKRCICAIKLTDFPLAQDDLESTVKLIEDLLSADLPSRINKQLLLKYKAIAHNKLGYCYYRRYRYHDGIEENTKALLLNPDLLEAYRDRLECHEALSHDSEAAEDRRMVEFLKRKLAVYQ
jgi:tetratricopeptide (TPR) repeat protein